MLYVYYTIHVFKVLYLKYLTITLILHFSYNVRTAVVVCIKKIQVKLFHVRLFVFTYLKADEGERLVSEEEMEAAALIWSKGLSSCPQATERKHPM